MQSVGRIRRPSAPAPETLPEFVTLRSVSAPAERHKSLSASPSPATPRSAAGLRSHGSAAACAVGRGRNLEASALQPHGLELIDGNAARLKAAPTRHRPGFARDLHRHRSA
jgi:hypothetical protein